VNESRDSDGDRMVDHKVILLTKNGEVVYGEGGVYINGVKGNFEDSIFIANTINQFLSSREFKLNSSKNLQLGFPQIFMLAFWNTFILSGVGSLYAVFQRTTLILDKNQSLVIRRSSTLIGLSTKSYPLASARKVEVQDFTNSYNNAYFIPVILLTTGEKFTLDKVEHRDAAKIMANQIRHFLYLPTED